MTPRIFTAALVAAAITAAAQSPRITVEMDSNIMTMGSQTALKVTVDLPSDMTPRLVGFPEIAPDGPGYVQFGPAQIVAADTSHIMAGDRRHIVCNYVLQAFDPGLYTLPRFGVVRSDGDTLFSDPEPLKVNAVEVDTVAMQLKPMAPIASAGMKWHDYIPMWLLWLLLVSVVLAAGIFCIFKFRKREEFIKLEHIKPVPPFELAMQRLDALRSERLAQSGHEKEFYTRLTDILRQYLQGRFGINAMEMTTTQIVKALRADTFTRRPADLIDEVLRIADFVKFAKERPLADDNERALRRAVDFVADTKPVPPPPTPAQAAKGANNNPVK
ncbi:MAG: hypothetical protein J6C67_03225 [Muribaculaceae bacterium]|nr:hypothetical protein [Muribaculaceae bacterium]